jgi:hypothetical protein
MELSLNLILVKTKHIINMKKSSETVIYDSSTVESSVYDFVKKDLLVEFKGGAKYYFEGVSNEDYLSFSTADSIGRSFSEFIRPYQGKKVTENAEA